MPKIVDHQVMREELLARSFPLFAGRGFHAVTMRDLARELGVSTGTLYHYFTSKTDLYGQMLRTLVLRDVGRVLGSMGETMSAQQRLRIVADYVNAHEEHFKDLLYLLFDFSRYSRTVPPDSSEALDLEKTRGVFRELLALYRNAIQENSGVTLEGIGPLIFSALVGALVQRIMEPAGAALEETHRCLELLLARPQGA